LPEHAQFGRGSLTAWRAWLDGAHDRVERQGRQDAEAASLGLLAYPALDGRRLLIFSDPCACCEDQNSNFLELTRDLQPEVSTHDYGVDFFR